MSLESDVIDSSRSGSLADSFSGEEDNLFTSRHDLFDRNLLQPISPWNPLPDNADTMQAITLVGIDDQTINPEDLSTDELHRCILVMLQSNITVQEENDLLESYLTDVDPVLIENMDKILEAATAAIHKAERTAQLGAMAAANVLPAHESSSSSPRSTGHSQTGPSSKIGGFAVTDKGPRVQPSQKTEIAQREIDKIRAALDEEHIRAERYKFNLDCLIEEEDSKWKEIQPVRKSFEECVRKEWVNPITKEVPGEKLITHFELRNKLDTSLIKTLHTKNKNLKIQLEALNSKIREMGEGLHYVDYEILEIHCQQVRRKLSDILAHLKTEKKKNTTYLQMLSHTRSSTIHDEEEKRKLQKDSKRTEQIIIKLLNEEEKTLGEIEASSRRIRRMEILMGKYMAPSVMDYIRHKAELQELKKALSIIHRKKYILRRNKRVRGDLVSYSKKIKKTVGNYHKQKQDLSYWNRYDSIAKD